MLSETRKIAFHHGTTVRVEIVFEINLWLNDLGSKFTILNSLFGAVKFAKKKQILISILILDMVLDLMYTELFQGQITVILVKI